MTVEAVEAARVSATLQELSSYLREVLDIQKQIQQSNWEAVIPAELPALVSTAAGTIDPVQTAWTPDRNYYYDFRTVTFVFGAGTTSVIVYRDLPDPSNEVIQVTTSGVWEPRQCIVKPGGHRLVFVSAGGGVTIRADQVNRIEAHYITRYLA
jgi:hypothetical protein